MKRLVRAAIVGALTDALVDEGSWAGETHVQKGTFFLQCAAYVPLGYDFIMYKHGPFSFSLRDDLVSFRADGLITLRPQAPYGPRLAMTDQGRRLRDTFPKTITRYNEEIRRVARFLNSRGVGELERLGTALYLRDSHQEWTDKELLSEMRKLKPHVREQQAATALADVRSFLELDSSTAASRFSANSES